MAQASGTSDERVQFRPLPVSESFRDAIRVEKAKEGVSYEQYLRQHLPIETDD